MGQAAAAKHAVAALFAVVAVAAPHVVIGPARPKNQALGDRTTVAFVELLEEPFVGLTAGLLQSLLADQAVACLIEAGIGLDILPLDAPTLHGEMDLAEFPLRDPWPDCRLQVCDRDCGVLSCHARLVDQIVIRAATFR